MQKELSPRIGTFSQTGTLGNLVDRLVHGPQRGIPPDGGALARGLGFPLLLNLTIWLAFLVTTSSLACAAVQLHPTGTAVPR